MSNTARFQILSDLHLEPSGYDSFHISPKAPYLALLGDIGNVKDQGFFRFLEANLLKFDVVFLVLGNHEPYHSGWPAVRTSLKAYSERLSSEQKDGSSPYGKFVLLDQTRYDISDDVTVLGCTLHSRITAEQYEYLKIGLNDFHRIQHWTPEDHCDAHLSDLAWLNAQVAAISSGQEPHRRRVVVFTHHSPTTVAAATDPAHAKSLYSSGFQTDLAKEPCWSSPLVRLWAFGHTHYNCDYKDEPTGKRVLANQRGYVRRQSPGFEEGKVVCI